MEEVERLISEVREPVFVAAEFPGHGVWADRGRYGAYVKALHDRFPESRWKEYVKHLWIIDSEKAVFAIPSFGGEPTEYDFYTEEAGLLAALLSVWARYLENAEKLSAQPVLVKSG